MLLKKLQELIDNESVCMFATNLMELPISARPMGVQKIDDQGIFWFFSPKSSKKNAHIVNSNDVQLFFSNPANSEFINVYGKAEIVYDRNKIDELWTPILKAWFKDGKDDPEITLIKIIPMHADYWDTKYGKLVSFMQIVTSAITGKEIEEGIQGTLTI